MKKIISVCLISFALFGLSACSSYPGWVPEWAQVGADSQAVNESIIWTGLFEQINRHRFHTKAVPVYLATLNQCYFAELWITPLPLPR